MARYQAEGLDRFDAWSDAEGHDIIMDMPTHAEVGRWYRIENQSQVTALLVEAVSYAEANGWRMQKVSDREYRGAKELEPAMGRLHLSTQPVDVLHDPEGPVGLRIRLDFGPVRFDDDTTTTT